MLAAALGLAVSFLAISGTIWIDGAGQPAYASNRSRAVGACVLVAVAFVCGLVSSLTPRLKGPTRCCLFVAIWALTSRYTEINSRNFTELFYPALVAAAVGLLANLLVFPRTARRSLTNLLIDLLETTCELLELTVDHFFLEQAKEMGKSSAKASVKPGQSEDSSTQRSRSPFSQKFHVQRAKLLSITARLDATFEAAKNEIMISRITVEYLKGFLPLFRNIRAWFACGMGLDILKKQDLSLDQGEIDLRMAALNTAVPQHGDDVQHGVGTLSPKPQVDTIKFEPVIRSLCQEIIVSLQFVKLSIQIATGTLSYGQVTLSDSKHNKCPHSTLGHGGSAFVHERIQSISLVAASVVDMTSSASPEAALLQQKKMLRSSILTFKESFGEALKQVRNAGQAKSGPQLNPSGKDEDQTTAEIDFASLFRGEIYAVSFLMVSLLEIAMLAESCLRVSLNVLRAWRSHPRSRIWWPVIQWRIWLSGTSAHTDEEKLGETADLFDTELDPEEEKQTTAYFEHDDDSVLCDYFGDEGKQKHITHRRWTLNWMFQHARRGLQRFTRLHRVLKVRLVLSRRIRRVRHSRHVKFGLKLATGVALLSLPAWLGEGAARTWWYEKRGQWMVISFLYCLETSTGASFRVSLFRVFGTFFGSLLGYVIWVVSQGNPYALAFLETLASVPAAHFMLFTKAEGVGIVMGLTTPIVSLIPALDIDYGSGSVVDLAWNRGYMIFLGIVAALLLNLFVWPLHARVELVRQISRCTRLLQSLYLSLSRQMLTGGFVASAESTAAFEALEVSVERKLAQARGLVSVMDAELSLIPKRTDVLNSILGELGRIGELLRGLRRCREHGLRALQQEAVLNVLELRQTMVASVQLVLWSTGQALLTHTPLPQALPAPRAALDDLTRAVAEQLRAPDAYHALSRLGGAGGGGGPSRPHSRRATPAATPHGLPRREYAAFFILAEHAMLSDITDALERLLDLTRSLVGEASFLHTSFVPNGGQSQAETPHHSLSQNQASALQSELRRRTQASEDSHSPPAAVRSLFVDK